MSTTDLRDPAAAQRLVDVPLTTYGRVDFVVANAGSGKTGDFLRLSDADGEEGFGLKLFGHMRLVRAAWPHLSSAQGSVILLAGRAGRTPSAHSMITGAFVDKIPAIRYASLPAEATAVAKLVLLDTLADAMAGAMETSGVAKLATAYVRDMGEASQSSVIGGGFKTSMQSAAYVNGNLASALEYHAAWSPPNRPASPTLPAILAIAKHLHLSGQRVIEAIVTAFEVQAHLAY